MRILLGTDICEIDRIQLLYSKYKDKFLNKLYTPKEIEYCLSKKEQLASRLAVRFATKEAVSKALGVGVNGLGWKDGIDWKDVELLRDTNGSISLKLHNKARELQEKLNIKNWTVSVSHSKRDAISTVIGYE